jgi:dihydroorotate dehydrogenase
MASIKFPVGVNIGKNRDTPLDRAQDDYVEALQILYGVADYLAVNLSSPNTPGLTGLQEGAQLQSLLARVREARDACAKKIVGPARPLFLKLSPDLTTEARKTAVEAAMAEGFEGIIASNTSIRRDFASLAEADALVVAEKGGLSGAPLREAALQHIRDIRSWIGPNPTIISVGGLGGGADAKERLLAGADFLQVYTEFVYSGPGFPRRLAREMTILS